MHKLLVTFELKPELPLSFQDFDVYLSITNIGDTYFSGGELTKFGVSFVNTSTEAGRSTLEKIPPIKPSETVKLKPHSFFAYEIGAASLRVSLKANDEDKVTLYQTVEHDMGDYWNNVFTIRNSDSATIINLLEKLIKLLEERKAIE